MILGRAISPLRSLTVHGPYYCEGFVKARWQLIKHCGANLQFGRRLSRRSDHHLTKVLQRKDSKLKYICISTNSTRGQVFKSWYLDEEGHFAVADEDRKRSQIYEYTAEPLDPPDPAANDEIWAGNTRVVLFHVGESSEDVETEEE